jgi:cysteate synthase
MPQHYKVKCQFCGTKVDDDGFILECPTKHEETALLITEFSAKRFEPDNSCEGIFRYHRWLPIRHHLHGAGKTVTYQSQKLCQLLELPNLWIAFNGYWPEKEARLEAATFKELEAYAVLSRLPAPHIGNLVVASAGNTARAFSSVCSQQKIPCLLVLPASGLRKLKFREPLDSCVKIVSLVGADYDDAIKLADHISRLNSFFPEGGVKNIGRRDGIGTTMLDAVETMGQLPDYYFQAIGSGAGAIAVHEAAKRLIGDGQFGQKLPRLMLSQNFPFIPIYNAWKSHQRQLINCSTDVSKQQVNQIVADVLSNQRPPYAIKGGVFDVLTESQGDMLFADNQETLGAIEQFQEFEGVAIEPAAGVALASLIKTVKHNLIDSNALVLLHITGGRGGECGFNRRLLPVEPTLQIAEHESFTEKTLEKLAGLF